MFIDCHAHLNIPNATKAAMKEIIKGAKEKKVDYIVGVIGDPAMYPHYRIQYTFTNVIQVIGIQRGQAMNDHSSMLSLLRNEIESKKPHAIGEIGLEYVNTNDMLNRKRQQILFRAQIQLAHELDLPIVVHAGFGTDKDLITILKEERAGDTGGQIHCCRNDLETIKQILDMGFFLSFGRPHIEDDQLANSVLHTPVERIHNETDSPYGLIGDPPKAKLLPADVVEITKKLALMKEMEITEFAGIVMQNARELFKF
ncbi:MAG: TatD family hydrolase [Promethearchaeota archaeon]